MGEKSRVAAVASVFHHQGEKAMQTSTRNNLASLAGFMLMTVAAANGAVIGWSQTAAGNYNFSTGSNWTGGAAPTLADGPVVNINTPNSIVIDWDAAAPNGDFADNTQYIVRNTGGGTATLNIGTGDTARFRHFNRPRIGVGGIVNLSGDNTAVFGANSSTGFWPVIIQGTLNQSGGQFVPASNWTVETGGIYNFSGGTCTDAGIVESGGTLNVTAGSYGGRVSVAGEVNISSTGAITAQFNAGAPGTNRDNPGNVTISDNGTWIFTMTGTWQGDIGGTWTVQDSGKLQNSSSYVGVRGTLNLAGTANDMAAFPNLFVGDTTGRPGTVNHTGSGTMLVAFGGGDPGLMIGSRRYDPGTGFGIFDAPGAYNLAGGTVRIDNDRAGNSPGLTISPVGILSGYGTIEGIDDGTPRQQLVMSGKTIADGGNLSFTGVWSAVVNPTDNTTDKGWYAINQGWLTLPGIPVTSGTTSYNWGEDAGDTSIDLINSARLDFSGHTDGTLTGELLALDHAAVPQFSLGLGKEGLISVHNFTTTAAPTSFDLTLHYDELAADGFESDLQIFHYTGGQWVRLENSELLGNGLIKATGITSFSLFAVGYSIPEPASAALLGLAGLATLRRRHRA